jgi:nicotinamidase-related amidase
MLRIPVRYYRPFPLENPLGHEPGIVEADPAHTAFLLVDVYLPARLQGGLETLSREDYEAKKRIVLDHIAPALVAAREIGLPIAYVANSAPRIAVERSTFGAHLAAVGTDFLTEFAEESVDPLEYHQGPVMCLSYRDAIAPQPGDYYIRKHVYSGFYGTRLESLLRHLDIDTLVAVGFRLDACLGSTLMDASYRNFNVILLRDCTLACDTPDEQPSRAYTSRMTLWYETMIGPTSISAAFIAACQDSDPAA